MQAVSFTGSHTFYMVFLPMLFWVGYSRCASDDAPARASAD